MNKKRSIRMAVSVIVFLIILGTFFYHTIESWSWVDSFYFTVVTLTTIGYGDLVPTHDISKILTAVFSMVMIPTVLFSFAIISESYIDRKFRQVEGIFHHHDKEERP